MQAIQEYDKAIEPGCVGKLKVNNARGTQNKIKKADSQFVAAKSNVTIIFNSLKEPLENVATFVQFGVENMFNPEVGFIGNADMRSTLIELITNFIARISFIGKNFFTRKVNLPPRDESIA